MKFLIRLANEAITGALLFSRFNSFYINKMSCTWQLLSLHQSFKCYYCSGSAAHQFGVKSSMNTSCLKMLTSHFVDVIFNKAYLCTKMSYQLI